MTLPTVDELIAEVAHPARVEFSRSRYPYTYAADFLRQHSHLVPLDVWKSFWRVGPIDTSGTNELPSRSAAATMRQMWAQALDVDDVALAERLADAYLRLHGIERTEASP